MINRTVLVGRLTKDPELRYTSSNIAVAKFTLAVNRQFGDRETDFIQCITWRQSAENLCKYQKKGALLGVEGRIQTGSFEDKDGKRVYTTDVVCDNVQYLEPKQQGFASEEQRQAYDDTKGFEERNKYDSIEVDPDSSLPF